MPPGQGKALTMILPAALQSTRSKAALLMRLQQEHDTGKLHKNVILNTDKNSSFSHIEFTPDTVRLEFLTSQDPTYRRLAEIATDDESPADVAVLVNDVKNLDYCGGGASVLLHRKELVNVLRSSIAASRSHIMLEDGTGKIEVPDFTNCSDEPELKK